MDHVLDASAMMIAYLRGEAGSLEIAALLNDQNCNCFAHNCQLNEVFWYFCREADEDRAEGALSDLHADGVVFRDDFDLEFCKQAARWRTLTKMSFADSFGLTLAQALGADFVTTDRHDLETVAAHGWLPVIFLTPSRKSHSMRYRLGKRLEDAIRQLEDLDRAEGTAGEWRELCRRVT